MLINVVLPLALAVIMWSLGLGLTVHDFRRVLVQPVAFLTGAAAQLVVVPLCAFLLVLAFGLTGELAVGVMLLSFCPGGVTSNIISRFARGDVALSVSLTAVVSLVTMFTVPLLVAWTVARFMGADAPLVDITSLGISMFLITALPVLIGVAMRHFAPAFVDQIESIVSGVALGLFIVIVLAALIANWSVFTENLPVLGPILILLNLVLVFVGYGLARATGRSRQEMRTIAVEAGVQNSTVGITLAGLIVAQNTGFSAFALPSAVYGITMYLVTVPAILWLRNVGERREGLAV